MRFLTLFATVFALLSMPAHAGFEGKAAGSSLGIFNKINCSTGVSCTKVGDVFTMVSSAATGSPLSVTALSATASYADLIANAGASNGDGWRIKSTTSQGGLQLLSNTSGSYVSKWSIDTSGNVSNSGTLAVTGATTLTGGTTVASGAFKNYGRAMESLTGGTDVTPGTTTVYLSQVFVRANATITGIKINNAATCATNKWIVALFDSTGASVANSDLAGTTCSGTDAYQTIAFTGTYAVKGPGVYWIALYANGTGAHFRALPAASEGSGYAGSVTGQSFGTVASVSLPTSFTADKGPVAFLY